MSKINLKGLVDFDWCHVGEKPALRLYYERTARAGDMTVLYTFETEEECESWTYACYHEIWKKKTPELFLEEK